MADTDLKIKVSVEAQLQQLRAMETQFQKQIVQLRTLGDTGSESLKTLERNLGSVRRALGNVGPMDKVMTSLGDGLKSIPGVGVAMGALNGSALGVGTALTVGAVAARQFFNAMGEATMLVDTAAQLDLTSTSVQALNAYFGDGGIRAEKWQMVMLKLNQTLAQAAAGSEPLQKAFASMGIDVGRLLALRPDERLAEVGRALAANRDNAEANAAAYQILGEQVGRLRNQLIDLGARGAGEVERTMVAGGRATEEHLNKRLNEAQLKWDALMQRVKNTRNEIVASLLLTETSQERSARLIAEKDAEFATLLTGNPNDESQRQEMLAKLQAALEKETWTLPSDAYRGMTNAQAEAMEQNRAARAERIRTAIARVTGAVTQAEKNDAAVRAKVAEDQAALDARMLAQHTARLALADQIAVAEAEIARLRAQLPEEENESLEAARLRVTVGQQLFAASEALGILRKQQAAEEAADRADEEAWLERMVAAEAERINLRTKEREREREQELSRRMAAADSGLTSAEQSRMLIIEVRDRARLAIMEEQRRVIAERIALLEREQALNPDPTRQAQIDGLRAKDGQIGADMEALRPLSVGEGAVGGLVDYINSIPDASERARAAVYGIAEAMEQGIGGSLMGLIEGTMTWQDALTNIGTSVVQAIIQSFVRMVSQWIVQQIVMAVAGKAIQAAQVAALAPIAFASAALWAPAATAASIATMGGAAVTGAAMAKTAILTAALGFAEGGFVSGPGTATSDSIFARLSNGEYVMPANRVAEYGVGFFDDLRAGRVPELASAPAAAGAGGGGGGGEPSVSMHQSFFFDREAAMRAAFNSPAGRRMFVDLLRGSQHEV